MPSSELEALVDADLSPRLARLLARRGIEDPEAVRRFLEPATEDLHDPRLLLGVDAAVERLLAARTAGERVAIVGDYDADGVSATAILTAVFRACRIDSIPILPHRMAEGYGFQPVHVERAAAEGVRVLVTADCGTKSHAAAGAALAEGIAVIVTDHHLPGEPLDPRVVLINPHQPGCEYPYGQLCGAGVAFKLALALAEAAQRPVDPGVLLRVACLGTIADLVPLTGENRAIAALGLRALETARSPGLKALLEVSNVSAPIRASDVGFRLAPRLNAAGRMDAPDAALELLLARDAARARAVAERLNAWNDERRQEELRVVEEARAAVVEGGEGDGEATAGVPRFLMAWSPDWHKGVLGIAAGRIAREFHRPTVLLNLDGEVATGSGRSVPGVHLHDFLMGYEERLDRFGGHSQAVGLSLPAAELEAVYAAILEGAAAWDPEQLVREHVFEEHLQPEELTPELVAEVERLEPFGVGNRRPLFHLGPLELPGAPREFGSGHLGLRARSAAGAWVDVTAWRWADRRETFERPFEILGRLTMDRFLGRPAVELVDARPAGSAS